MNDRTLEKLPEPIETNIPVACTKSLRARYRDLATRLKQANKVNILPERSREALSRVMDDVERLLKDVSA